MPDNRTSSPILDLQRQHDLLQLEYDYEKETYRQQTEAMGIGRKIKRGICWYPLSVGRSYYNSLNQLVVEVQRHEDLEIEHNFEFGKPVCFFTQDASGKLKYRNFTAQVSYADEDRMVVVLPSPAALMEIQGLDNLGVQLYFDETSYRTMFEALADVMRTKGNRLAELRDIILGNMKAQQRNFFPVRFPWLNTTQDEAVNKVLRAKDVAIVHGPPGTGKTTTLVEAIYETLHRENQVLVCAQSNMAVDWISEKLVDRGVNVLRIGNPTRVNDKMLSFTYEKRFESHPDYSELWSIRKAVRQMHEKLRKSSDRDSVRNKINALKDRATELEIRINESLFGEARVIASTLVSTANKVLTGRKFSTLFIDEAAQALEAACWIGIRKADRVILAGDHQQLPPTIKCLQAARGGLDVTMMQKIVEHKPETVSLLKIQYRMHEDIMGFSSEYFYDGELQSAPEVKNRGILDYDTPMVWYNTEGCNFNEEFISESSGRINKSEAFILMQKLEKYITQIGEKRVLEEKIDFGIISPYKVQVKFLRQLVNFSGFLKPFKNAITVNTVDGFQGQERDVILLSLVRANAEGRIGFLGDLRRINVAITRARMKLIILGDASTLTQHPFYEKLYKYIEKHGQVVTLTP